jgi:glycogen phosphorylase
MEFLIGRSLANNLVNLGVYDEAAAALDELRQDLGHLQEWEPDAALGNGGLGRLAACFLDSLATLGLPAWGFGILYEYGLFRQEIHDGRQVERPDSWLTFGSPWLVERPERAVPVRLYGHVVNAATGGGCRPAWAGGQTVLGVPHDLPIVGYGGRHVNLLRLFSARAPQQFDMHAFNDGQFMEAVSEETKVGTIHKVLYPNDHVARGPELRLVQEYFLVACAVHTILNFFEFTGHKDVTRLPDKAAVQLNDTHPALTVAELMRVLVDVHHLPWEKAWEVTTATCAYTNHTLMPEALEKWPVPLVERVLPRHLDIIYEINRRHLDRVAHSFPDDFGKLRRTSLIEEGPTKQVRMAHLAIVGSHSVNGVAAIHSELVKTHLVPDFYALTPEKFNNKTNGVTPRRWLRLCNPGLAQLIT